jgi:hypothetical protein
MDRVYNLGSYFLTKVIGSALMQRLMTTKQTHSTPKILCDTVALGSMATCSCPEEVRIVLESL